MTTNIRCGRTRKRDSEYSRIRTIRCLLCPCLLTVRFETLTKDAISVGLCVLSGMNDKRLSSYNLIIQFWVLRSVSSSAMPSMAHKKTVPISATSFPGCTARPRSGRQRSFVRSTPSENRWMTLYASENASSPLKTGCAPDRTRECGERPDASDVFLQKTPGSPSAERPSSKRIGLIPWAEMEGVSTVGGFPA